MQHVAGRVVRGKRPDRRRYRLHKDVMGECRRQHGKGRKERRRRGKRSVQPGNHRMPGPKTAMTIGVLRLGSARYGNSGVRRLRPVRHGARCRRLALRRRATRNRRLGLPGIRLAACASAAALALEGIDPRADRHGDHRKPHGRSVSTLYHIPRHTDSAHC